MPPSGTTVVRDRPNQRWTRGEEEALRRGIEKCDKRRICLVASAMSVSMQITVLEGHGMSCFPAASQKRSLPDSTLVYFCRRHGAGKWQQINLDPDVGPALAGRSNVDLKVT